MFFVIAGLVIGAVVWLLVRKRNASAPKPFVATSPAPTGWTIAYSPGMPTTMVDGFDFPQLPGSVHYIFKSAPPVRMGQTIRMRFRIDGEGTLLPTKGDPPARVRLFFERAGDDMTKVGTKDAPTPYSYYRWWSVATVALTAPGEFELAVVVSPDQWSSVYGERGDMLPGAFEAAVAEMFVIGFTWGGVFAGHGVYADNTAHFTLIDYSII